MQEASAYLAHPLLGPRLLECTDLVNGLEEKTAQDIFGPVDARKFHYSMTLFANAAPARPEFVAAIDHYFAGQQDHDCARLRLNRRAESAILS